MPSSTLLAALAMSAAAAAAPSHASKIDARAMIAAAAARLPAAAPKAATSAKKASAVAGPAPPPRPTWPTEWSAEITHVDQNTNQTAQFYMYSSYTHNATTTSVRSMDSDVFYDSISLFAQGVQYNLAAPKEGAGSEGIECSPSPVAGSVAWYDFSQFTFGGTGQFMDQTVWLWQTEGGVIGTAQTPQQEPVVVLDTVKNDVTAFSDFNLVPSGGAGWPIGFWTKPAACGC